ncbi:MCE family protein [Mycolicibacillus parakoreensis]|uniref:MlaD family protein n=1 Tax=Mycolicibacillus parakoreensis TaxID=1069221 RepID=A0ABY3TYG8_9MYCO|nr:MlaD family protein [Mycolicibacillus parakoreensis]MCV7316533.1 MCE family protein [Mycolicibacillus parakoreensis]ULN52758.1 MlaD family protein [Mycolicibacillus parakoreensis]HLR98356.1 MlaD family protein [Mycolicibacillus parakoreensis]
MNRAAIPTLRTLLALALTAALAASCASLRVESLPTPGGVRDGYALTFEFANVLNLPDHAEVVLDGVRVGTVTDTDLAGDRVAVTARLESHVAVPADVHAVLQQATVLGDIYLALQRPPGGGAAAPLPPGAVVPLAQTTSPAQIEDTIAGLANFVASGTIQRAQNTVIRLNQVAATSDRPLAEVIATTSGNLAELADNLQAAELTLDALAQTAAVLGGKRTQIAGWFSPAGMLGFDRTTQVLARLGVMIPSIGSVYTGGFWLVPMLTNVAAAAGAVQDTKWAVEDEYPRWRRLLLDYFLPEDKYPAINITSIVGPDGRELSGDVETVLRMLGAVP